LKSKTNTKNLPADSQTSKLHQEAIQKLTELGFRGSTREKSPVPSDSKKEREDFLASQQTAASSIQDIQVKFRFEVAKFVLQNNLPISLTDKLITFAKNIANNFDIKDLNEVTVNRNHTASFAIAIGTALQSRYLQILENQPYSIAIDAETGEGNEEFLAINRRYFESEGAKTSRTTLLGLLLSHRSTFRGSYSQNAHKFLI